MTRPMLIDATQYCNWSRSIFEEMVAGGLCGVQATVAYHENFRDTVDNLVAWNWRFRRHGDLILPGRTADDLERARRTGRTAIFLGLQNPSPIEADIGLVRVLHDLGIRFMQLSYNNQSLLCAGWTEPEDAGLTNMGKQVVEEMNRLGMVVDMSHSGERSTLEAIDLSRRPVAVTHANPSSWHATARNKSDHVLKQLAARRGMVGLSLYPVHLAQGSATTIEDFCDMAARLSDLIGPEHIGIGSDLCRGQPGSVLQWMREGRWRPPLATEREAFEFPPQPAFFRSSLDFAGLGDGLRAAGFAAAEVAGILGDNWHRFMRAAFEPGKDAPPDAAHDAQVGTSRAFDLATDMPAT